MKKILGGISIIILSATMGSAMAADAAAGKAKAAVCAGCHGPAGISIAPNFPNLAGQKEVYLLKQLKDFKAGVRNDPSMKAMIAALSEADMANLAAYYAGLK